MKNAPMYYNEYGVWLGGFQLQTLGKHYLLDLKDCNKDLLNDIQFLKTTLSEVSRQTQDAELDDSFYQFTPQGVSGLVLSHGSHICIHTWPEYGYAAVDVFTLRDTFNPREAADQIIEKLESQSPAVIELKRGAPSQ